MFAAKTTMNNRLAITIIIIFSLAYAISIGTLMSGASRIMKDRQELRKFR